MIRLIITDLDNTLYNWVDYYVPSFLAMVKEISRTTDIEEERLKAEFKRVHERYRTTEYSFAIQELDIFRTAGSRLSGPQVLKRFGTAIHEFRKVRRQTLRLYDGVEATLNSLRRAGKRIAGVTESLEFHACYRLRELRIEQLFDALIAPPDHGFPPATEPSDVRLSDPRNYECRIPVRYTPPTIRKPEPMYLQPLLQEMKVSSHECVLVGDSLYKDILMAKRCDIPSCLAKYGQIIRPENYRELLKITYWTDADVQADRELRLAAVRPDFVLESFEDLLEVVEELDRA